MEPSAETRIVLRDVTMAYDQFVILRNIDAHVKRGEIFIIMGGSGTGKSTLLKAMIGMKAPSQGEVLYDGCNYWRSSEAEQQRLLRNFGILFQSGALWSSMTLLENVTLPLSEHTNLLPEQVKTIARLKLALVGLAGFEDFHPSEISGGMRKRAALARAMALDPEFLFFDEPSAGLDPLSSRRLDDLILQLRDSLGATVVIVTHELASILSIGDRAIFLDAETKTIRAEGNPKDLLKNSDDAHVREFLTRGQPT
jgi:phospholipid/cholesterol/gamma-HCH transport system ATP-binding protein